MHPLNPDNGILFWAEKNCALGKLIGNARPVIMVHPQAPIIDTHRARSLGLAIRQYPMMNKQTLFFLAQDHIGAPSTKAAIHSLFGYFNEWAGKDSLSDADHRIVGKHLGFGDKTIELMIQHRAAELRKPHQLNLDL